VSSTGTKVSALGSVVVAAARRRFRRRWRSVSAGDARRQRQPGGWGSGTGGVGHRSVAPPSAPSAPPAVIVGRVRARQRMGVAAGGLTAAGWRPLRGWRRVRRVVASAAGLRECRGRERACCSVEAPARQLVRKRGRGVRAGGGAVLHRSIAAAQHDVGQTNRLPVGWAQGLRCD
jgi:hypothetical protein